MRHCLLTCSPKQVKPAVSEGSITVGVRDADDISDIANGEGSHHRMSSPGSDH